MSHDTHIHQSCHIQASATWAGTYECVMSHTWKHLFTHTNESWHTYARVMSHTGMCDMRRNLWISHVMHMDASVHTYRWVMAHIWTSHVTHRCLRHGQALVNALSMYVCTFKWFMSLIHVTHICHTYERVMSQTGLCNMGRLCTSAARGPKIWAPRQSYQSFLTYGSKPRHLDPLSGPTPKDPTHKYPTSQHPTA